MELEIYIGTIKNNVQKVLDTWSAIYSNLSTYYNKQKNSKNVMYILWSNLLCVHVINTLFADCFIIIYNSITYHILSNVLWYNM